jgi:hypothetical protein
MRQYSPASESRGSCPSQLGPGRRHTIVVGGCQGRAQNPCELCAGNPKAAKGSQPEGLSGSKEETKPLARSQSSARPGRLSPAIALLFSSAVDRPGQRESFACLSDTSGQGGQHGGGGLAGWGSWDPGGGYRKRQRQGCTLAARRTCMLLFTRTPRVGQKVVPRRPSAIQKAVQLSSCRPPPVASTVWADPAFALSGCEASTCCTSATGSWNRAGQNGQPPEKVSPGPPPLASGGGGASGGPAAVVDEG